MSTFCTIITNSHLAHAKALHKSLQRFGKYKLTVLVVDADLSCFSNDTLTFISLNSLKNKLANSIINKYNVNQASTLRWSLKPILMHHLLGLGYEKVVFCDPDIYFYGDANEALIPLEKHRLLLTPHWECFDPEKNLNAFIRNQKNGFFNAGFIAANKYCIDILDWWSNLCLFACEKNTKAGLYDDQGYLSLFPVIFEGVGVIRNKGWNVADWNIEQNPRKKIQNQVMVDGYPILFVHFAQNTIGDILDGEDHLLQAHLDEYMAVLNQFKVNQPA